MAKKHILLLVIVVTVFCCITELYVVDSEQLGFTVLARSGSSWPSCPVPVGHLPPGSSQCQGEPLLWMRCVCVCACACVCACVRACVQLLECLHKLADLVLCSLWRFLLICLLYLFLFLFYSAYIPLQSVCIKCQICHFLLYNDLMNRPLSCLNQLLKFWLHSSWSLYRILQDIETSVPCGGGYMVW